jgi:hypothetical protein
VLERYLLNSRSRVHVLTVFLPVQIMRILTNRLLMVSALVDMKRSSYVFNIAYHDPAGFPFKDEGGYHE